MENKKAEIKKRVHFSIDDCLPSFRFLTENRDKIFSIFDLEFYGKLKEYHDTFDAKFSLYCFEEKKGFHILETCEDYKKDFLNHALWLRLGFHGSENPKRPNGEGFSHFCRAFMDVKKAVSSFATEEAWTDSVRLHYYSATPEEVSYLHTQGITKLFTAHDERISYDLTAEETAIVNKNGSFRKNGMEYQKTDLCVETMSEDLKELDAYRDKDVLVIVAHEWGFRKETEKLDRILFWLKEQGFTFL